MDEVNPSQKSPSDTHKAWVAIQKEHGQVITGHCTCKDAIYCFKVTGYRIS